MVAMATAHRRPKHVVEGAGAPQRAAPTVCPRINSIGHNVGLQKPTSTRSARARSGADHTARVGVIFPRNDES